MNPAFRKPVLLTCSVQRYAWGSRSADSLVASLTGERSGEPCAELWMGVHAKGPSMVRDGKSEVSLADYISRAPAEIVGPRVLSQFGASLPFLFKVLSVAEPLSIQAHPDRSLAEALHARNPEHYPDRNHKPEIAVAVSPVTMLCGVRGDESIAAALTRLPALGRTFGKLEAPSARSLLRALFLMPEGEALTLSRELVNEVESRSRRSEEEEAFLQIAAKYPDGDIGLAAFFLLQYLRLQPGEAIFTGPFVPHAYLSGDIIECMANSDNVVRAGLTPKYRDAASLCLMLESAQGLHGLRIVPRNEGGWKVYESPASEFAVALSGEGKTIETSISGPEIVIALEGKVAIENSAAKLWLEKGQIVLIPAAMERYVFDGRSGSAARAFVP